MSFGNVMFRVEAAAKEKVSVATWGHLAPVKNSVYTGYIIFAHSAYGDILIIDSNFEGLSDSPWLFQSMNDYVSERKTIAGNVYRFDGAIKNYKCIGKVRKLNLE